MKKSTIFLLIGIVVIIISYVTAIMERQKGDYFKTAVKPEEETPEEETPEEVTPEEVTPEEVTPEEVTPEEVTPEEVTPEEVIPEDIPDNVKATLNIEPNETEQK